MNVSANPKKDFSQRDASKKKCRKAGTCPVPVRLKTGNRLGAIEKTWGNLEKA
jgi:hypothetical protein